MEKRLRLAFVSILKLLKVGIVIAGTGIVLLLSVTVYGQSQNKYKHAMAVVDCINGTFTSVGEPDTKRNKVHEGKHLAWYFFGDEGTKVTITFGTKTDYPDCKATSPTGQPVITDTIGDSEKAEKVTSANVKTGMSGASGECYAYTITCQPASYTDHSHDKSIDPIIDVPPK
jgi:hypothetical protein